MNAGADCLLSIRMPLKPPDLQLFSTLRGVILFLTKFPIRGVKSKFLYCTTAVPDAISRLKGTHTSVAPPSTGGRGSKGTRMVPPSVTKATESARHGRLSGINPFTGNALAERAPGPVPPISSRPVYGDASTPPASPADSADYAKLGKERKLSGSLKHLPLPPTQPNSAVAAGDATGDTADEWGDDFGEDDVFDDVFGDSEEDVLSGAVGGTTDSALVEPHTGAAPTRQASVFDGFGDSEDPKIQHALSLLDVVGEDLGVRQDAQEAPLGARPARDVSEFDNLTSEGTLVHEATQAPSGKWTLNDSGAAPAPGSLADSNADAGADKYEDDGLRAGTMRPAPRTSSGSTPGYDMVVMMNAGHELEDKLYSRCVHAGRRVAGKYCMQRIDLFRFHLGTRACTALRVLTVLNLARHMPCGGLASTAALAWMPRGAGDHTCSPTDRSRSRPASLVAASLASCWQACTHPRTTTASSPRRPLRSRC